MCKKPFVPGTIDPNIKYLVVDGLINSGADSTFIRLSRTGKIDTYYENSAIVNPELKAVVTVEDDKNTSYPLKETTLGNYVAPPLNLDASRNYRLRIITADGQVYLSDYVPVKSTPAIDSVGYTVSGNGVQVYANAHDAANNTRYYRWEFEETWQFRTFYFSKYLFMARPRLEGVATTKLRTEPINICFTSDVSSDIILGSTAKLAQDVLYQAPITSIAPGSEKISMRYSILVKQYALTKEAYEFWSDMKKNSESLGSIFDAQPSNPQGNIHCTSNPAMPVIGYVSVSTVQRKRIFIDKSDVRGLTYLPPNCRVDTVFFTLKRPLFDTLDVLDKVFTPDSNWVGYSITSRACVDCTIRGTINPPPFWK